MIKRKVKLILASLVLLTSGVVLTSCVDYLNKSNHRLHSSELDRSEIDSNEINRSEIDSSGLNRSELASALIGHTEYGRYQHLGYDIEFAQYYSPDGSLTGASNQPPYRYRGIYQLRDKGCFFTDMATQDNAADGCNYYQRITAGTSAKGNRYRVHGPYQAVTDVTVVWGNQVALLIAHEPTDGEIIKSE